MSARRLAQSMPELRQMSAHGFVDACFHALETADVDMRPGILEEDQHLLGCRTHAILHIGLCGSPGTRE